MTKVGASHVINSFAAFLSTAIGFLATSIGLVVGVAIGWLVHFSDGYMLVFNLLLSIAAIIISPAILVSGARSEAALQVKLDYLIANSKAPNATIGLEHKEAAEIEAERQIIEKKAREELDEAIDEAVEEEVTEQLNERSTDKTRV